MGPVKEEGERKVVNRSKYLRVLTCNERRCCRNSFGGDLQETRVNVVHSPAHTHRE